MVIWLSLAACSTNQGSKQVANNNDKGTLSLEITPFLRYYEKKSDNDVERFRDYLASLYLRYSNLKLANKEYSRSDYYTSKSATAMSASKLVNVNFENLAIPNAVKTEMRYAQQRIAFLAENNLIADIFSTYKFAIADMFFYFDCWAEQETVGHKENNALEYAGGFSCKNLFFQSLNILEERINMEKIRLVEQKMSNELAKVKQGEVLFVVYFDFDQDVLNENALKTIIDILHYLQNMRGNFVITLVGHADRAGKYMYNQVLANKRVERVRATLSKNGVPLNSMQVISEGKENPWIPTVENREHKNNRRVEVYIRPRNIL